jgi:hypothetical protein
LNLQRILGRTPEAPHSPNANSALASIGPAASQHEQVRRNCDARLIQRLSLPLCKAQPTKAGRHRSALRAFPCWENPTLANQSGDSPTRMRPDWSGAIICKDLQPELSRAQPAEITPRILPMSFIPYTVLFVAYITMLRFYGF